MMDLRLFGPKYSEVVEALREPIKQGLIDRLWFSFPEVRVRTGSQAVVDLLADRFGSALFSTDGEPMERIVGNLLKYKGFWLAAAESCTGGLISHRITNIPGSSEYFRFGAVVYSNEAKQEVLGVNQKTLDTYGAVSRETVHEMLEGVMRVGMSDVAVAASGIAGPGGGTPQKPVGTVYIGARVQKTEVITHNLFKGDREQIKVLSASTALFMLLELLKKA